MTFFPPKAGSELVLVDYEFFDGGFLIKNGELLSALRVCIKVANLSVFHRQSTVFDQPSLPHSLSHSLNSAITEKA
jgi:hypothetical protein